MMESLFKLSELESRFPMNMNVLVDGVVPRVLSLAEALWQWLDHRRDVLLRRSRHRLAEIAHRLEVLAGMLIVYLHLDEVIRIIREEDEPKQALMARFTLTEVQANYILDTRLRSLRRLEEMQLRKEYDELVAEKTGLDGLVSDEAQHRARGSSAWRGALDIEISIVPGKDGQPMEIVQRKSKDSEMAQPVYAELRSVEIPGWLDEDGEQVKSAVVEICAEAPAKPERKKESKVDGFRKQFENAWWESGAEELDGVPYVSRSALRDILLKVGKTERTVRNDLDPSYNDKMIGALMLAEIISKTENGWVICNEISASALLIRKSSYA
jgi:hypothetical protein